MSDYIISYNWLHQFTNNTSKTNWSVINYFCQRTFFIQRSDICIAYFHSNRIFPFQVMDLLWHCSQSQRAVVSRDDYVIIIRHIVKTVLFNTNPSPNPKFNPITNLTFTLTITSALTRFNIKCELVPPRKWNLTESKILMWWTSLRAERTEPLYYLHSYTAAPTLNLR